MRNWPHALLLSLIAVIVGLNCLKPLHIDDPVYYEYARQISQHPLDPYGFEVFWFQWPEPANWAVAPPVFLYWWGLGIKLLGENPVLWKVWASPFVAMFVYGLFGLLRRFAPGAERPLVMMTALSPAILPAVNLMLDVPALGLGLTALCLLFAAIDRANSRWLTTMAGVVMALAMQTKYTALIVPVIGFAYAARLGRPWPGLMAAVLGATLFWGWEAFVAWRYGWSHFLFHLGWTDRLRGQVAKADLFYPLLTLGGAMCGSVALAGAVAMGLPISWTIAAGAALLAAHVSVVVPQVGDWHLIILGTASALLIIAVAIRLFTYDRTANRPDVIKVDQFLFAWLLIEVLAYFFITPFPASRRLIGIVVVSTIIIGSLLSRAPHRTVWVASIVSAMLGTLYAGIDLLEARANVIAVQRAANTVGHAPAVWYVGHWGLQYYAQREGWRPLVPDHSKLGIGDIIVHPQTPTGRQQTFLPRDHLFQVENIEVNDAIRLTTTPCYYTGARPMLRRNRPRVDIEIFRVTRPFLAVTRASASELIDWALVRSRPLPPLSVRILLASIQDSQGESATRIRALIAASGPAALAQALDNKDSAVRLWAINELARLGPQAIETLAEMRHRAAEDPDAAVRAAAERAVNEIERPPSKGTSSERLPEN